MDNLNKWLEYQEVKDYGIDLDNGIISMEDLGIDLDDIEDDIYNELNEFEEGVI